MILVLNIQRERLVTKKIIPKMQILIIDKKACYSLYLYLLVRSLIGYISPSHSVNVNHERGNNFQETFRIAANDN